MNKNQSLLVITLEKKFIERHEDYFCSETRSICYCCLYLYLYLSLYISIYRYTDIYIFNIFNLSVTLKIFGKIIDNNLPHCLWIRYSPIFAWIHSLIFTVLDLFFTHFKAKQSAAQEIKLQRSYDDFHHVGETW